MKLLNAVLLLTILSACGDPASVPKIKSTPSNDKLGPSIGVSESQPSSDLPGVEVIDVRDGTKVNVGSIGNSGTPLLVWFWAPH